MRSLQWRITIPLIVLILVSMSVLGAYLSAFIRNTQLEDLKFHLEQKARITGEAVMPSLQGNGEDIETLVERLGNEIDARITIIAVDGVVLGDSLENPAAMENHASRPEVSDALASGVGESTRYSTTLGKQMMYVAVPIAAGKDILGVARVALPIEAVVNTVNRVRWIIVLSMVIIALLTIIAAWLITRFTTASIRQLTKAARGMAEGQLGQMIPVSSRDDTGRLAQAFNEMSAGLKSTMDSISAEKAKLSNILANMADGLIMAGISGEIILVNKAAGKLFGFSELNVEGRPVIELVHDHEVDEVFKRCLQHGREQTIQFESGITRRFIRAIAVPLSNHGRTLGALVLFQDLTELRNLQTMRREMVGNIGHELRTPLAGIKAMVETLLDGALDEKQTARDFLTRIQSDVDKLSHIVSEITQLSRIEYGQVELKIEPLNLNDIADEILKEMRPLAERQHLALSLDLMPSLPVVPADKDRLRQTVINLVHNAVKFNKPGGSIIISTAFSGEKVSLTVSDTGIGISSRDLPHVFERFYKAEKSRGGGGSGLGLAIAKHTVQAHGGDISVQSREGEGSEFTINLPRR